MERIKIEICCGSAGDVFTAARAGADRAELSSCLYFGGLTASAGEVRAASQAGIPVIAMTRCREGGFCYTPSEIKIMTYDAEELLKNGAAGIVFGGIDDMGLPDMELCRNIVSVCGSRDKVFHKAFDLMESNWKKSLDILIQMGITRVLTSGFRRSAAEGAENIAAMRDFAQGAIEILPGGGIRYGNLREISARTGCSWLHTSAGRERRCGGEHLFNENVSFIPDRLSEGPEMLSGEAVRVIMERAGKI